MTFTFITEGRDRNFNVIIDEDTLYQGPDFKAAYLKYEKWHDKDTNE